MRAIGAIAGVLACACCGGDAMGVPTIHPGWESAGPVEVLSRTVFEAGDAALAVAPAGSGVSWRAVVEAGPYAGQAGIRLTGSDATAAVLDLAVDGSDAGGVCLAGARGEVLWSDSGLGSLLYQPVWLEAVLDAAAGVRVQVLDGDATALLAQSPWLPVGSDLARGIDGMAVFTRGNTARFCLWERAQKPLAPLTPDNPTALRVPRAGDDAWAVVGGGAWRWETGRREVLLQTRPTERTTAFMTPTAPAEGMWRCTIRLDKGTCGGGMVVHGDRDLAQGFLAWLGGSYGNGRLMVYQYPLKCLWSGPDGIWHWDTDYVLEAEIRGGTLRARLLAADGAGILAESPSLSLDGETPVPPGMIGFQTWRGTGRFGGFGAGGETGPAAGRDSAQDLGAGWRALAGDWRWIGPPGQTLRQSASEGAATALAPMVRGARGRFRCRVTPAGAHGVSLLFQHAENGQDGFECCLAEDGTSLRTAAGKVLWTSPAVRCQAGQERVLEGIVATDRVRVRVLDAEGRSLCESVDCYVSDTNNERVGILGLRCRDGAAEFRGWEFHGEP
ncbi:MAG: hypothetical protein JXR77_06380 [Lentisphaeria bacterium]|nr:hypothetical protein [Lentisphaeria bacterium]